MRRNLAPDAAELEHEPGHDGDRTFSPRKGHDVSGFVLPGRRAGGSCSPARITAEHF